jgi:hypothetical protein
MPTTGAQTVDNHSAPPADGLEPQPPLRSVHTSTFPALLSELGIPWLVSTHQASKLVVFRPDGDPRNTPTIPLSDPGDSVSGTVPTLHGVFLARLAPQDTQVVGPIVVFNDPVFFDIEAFQLRDRHGHGVRLQLQELYLATGQMVVVLSSSTGQLNGRDLVAGEYVLTIDGRQVFDAFGRGPLGGVQKVRFFPLLSDPGTLGALAAALGLPSPA